MLQVHSGDRTLDPVPDDDLVVPGGGGDDQERGARARAPPAPRHARHGPADVPALDRLVRDHLPVHAPLRHSHCRSPQGISNRINY